MSKESLETYKILSSVDVKYVDNSGLFEILESIYLQLCSNNPYFNAYTEYNYFNVIKDHTITFFKQKTLYEKEYISRLFISSNSGIIFIRQCNYNDSYKSAIEGLQTFSLDSNTFLTIKKIIEDWFDEILINVKKENKL